MEGKLAAGLRKLGVDYVFDTTWAADLTIMEEAAELQDRLERYFAGDKDVKLPMLTSCCPAWVKFIEQNYGDMLDVPSTAKSPMQMFATVAKDIWAKEKGLKRDEVTSVAIMPCIAKKYEASRPEFSRGLNYDVDYVITTRELIKIFQDSGIDLKTLEEEEIDTTKRNVLLSHQFYLSGGSEPLTCDSEIRMAGGIDEIDTRLLEDFDYVALGHIHRAQRIGKRQCTIQEHHSNIP